MTPFRDSCWLAGPVLLSYVTHLYCSYVAWKELFPFRQFLGSFSSGVPMQPIPNEDFYSPNTHYQLCLEKGPESCPTACTSPPPPPPLPIACWGSRGMQAPVAPPAPRYYRHKPSPIHPCMYTRSISALPFRVRGGDQGGQQSALASCVTSTSDFTPHQASHLTLPPLHNPRQFEFKH